MTQPNPLKRPKFEEIFYSKHLWALDKNELKIDNQMKRIIEEKSKDKQSIYYIIYAKLYNNLNYVKYNSNRVEIQVYYH
jgi:hypothetical protein